MLWPRATGRRPREVRSPRTPPPPARAPQYASCRILIVPSVTHSWLPKSVVLLRTYTTQAFVADLLAGVTVGLVALPLAMAFAISSGVLPQSGLYCPIVTGFLVSALGGSRFQIAGPTGAVVPRWPSMRSNHGS